MLYRCGTKWVVAVVYDVDGGTMHGWVPAPFSALIYTAVALESTRTNGAEEHTILSSSVLVSAAISRAKILKFVKRT